MAISAAMPSRPTDGSSSSPPVVSDREQEKRVKLQNFLVMKAFNMRKGKQTLAQQFQCLRQVDPMNGKGFMELGSLCEYLSIPPFRRLVLCQIFGLRSDATASTRLDFDGFLRFLQTAAVHAAHEEDELQRQYSSSASLPMPPPRSSALENQENALVCFAPSLLSMRFARPPPAPGLWKKREITIQERITEYTKIDEQGRAQHLVEKERHQSEVIHMESLSGEFAHREITQFEQLEQLNDEVVHHETGREEFVHLKSQHDEVSKFESSIPTSQHPSRPEECEQPPPSPTIKRDPSAMDCGQRGFQSPGRGGGGVGDEEYPQEEDEDVARMMAMEEEEYGVHADAEAEYPMEPPPME